MCDGKRSRSRYAVILGIGCSLGAGPWRCDPLGLHDVGSGTGSGSAAGSATGSGPGAGSGVAEPIPPPSPPPTPTPPPSPPPPPPLPTRTPPPSPPPIATTPRREEPTRRETLGPKKPPPPPRVAIPEEVVMRAVRTLQPTFLACWKRAQRNDPSLVSARVRLSLEVDASGAVASSRTDAEDEQLSRCLASVARKLTFPAPGGPAALDVPLYF